jgi:TolB protein
VAFRDWRTAGQEFLVIGRMSPAKDNAVRVEYEVYDVIKEELILRDAHW